MLPILTTEQVRRSDTYTIENEPVDSIDLMERACEAFFKWFKRLFDEDHRVAVVCGPGNNGGDGLGVARLLKEAGYKVKVYVVPSENTSADFAINLDRYSRVEKIIPLESGEMPDFKEDIIIDALFGSGISRAPEGIFAEVIDRINETESLVVAIDMPSGLRGEQKSSGSIVMADFTVTFQYPKIGLLMPENADYVGEWEVVDIGLMPEALTEENIDRYLIQSEDITSIWPIRGKFEHKRRYGHVLLAGGSYGKIGAMVLSGKAALRSGAGLVTSHVPACGYPILQTAVPEIMVSVDPGQFELSGIEEISSYDVVACGPGMGQSNSAVQFLKGLLHHSPSHLVLDADALNILATHRDLLPLLPKNTILTPHPGEFKRLVGDWKDDFQKLKLLGEFSRKYQLIIVLKGAHSAISLPSGDLYFNSTGNPGMATAGSGDVLTGIIAGLLGQWKDPVYAAIAGTYLHGLAGDLAALDLGEDSVIASDIIDYLHEAIQDINQ